MAFFLSIHARVLLAWRPVACLVQTRKKISVAALQSRCEFSCSLGTFCAFARRPLPPDNSDAVARRQQKHPGADGVKGVLVHEIADDENQRHL